MDWILVRAVDKSHCEESVENDRFNDFFFADNAVILTESPEVFVLALEELHDMMKPMGLKVFWLKTKVQVFGGLLDDMVLFVLACGEDTEITEDFTYL